MSRRICRTLLAGLVLIAMSVVFFAVGTLPTFAAAAAGRPVVIRCGRAPGTSMRITVEVRMQARSPRGRPR